MRKRYRAQQITIDTPRTGEEVLIRTAIQTVDCDETNNNKIMNETPTMDFIYKSASKIAFDMIEVTDPVTGKVLSMSVAGLHTAIQQLVSSWIVDKYDAVQEGTLVWQS